MDETEILRAEIQRLNAQRDTAWEERDALRAEVESLRTQLAAQHRRSQVWMEGLAECAGDLAAVRTDLSVARAEITRLEARDG